MPELKQSLSSAHHVIPGGAHTYSKGDDQFPVTAPHFIEKAIGCRAYDPDGIEYIDWMMGLRSAPLGFGNEQVLSAVTSQLQKGPNFSRPSQLEEKVASQILSFIPHHHMVKFTKNGSNATTAAVKLARAYTGRDMVLCCADHPFFSFDDWFIGTTACPSGIPDATKKMTKTFPYNNLQALEHLLAENVGTIACVIMEAATDTKPKTGYLKGVERLCQAHGVVFILDEMITGFRFANGGASEYFDLLPDLATYGKGLGNGFSVSALTGRREIMELGGILPDKERLFLLSTTHGAENHSLSAASAVLDIYQNNDIITELWNIGAKLKDAINRTASIKGLNNYIEASGYACSPIFTCKNNAGITDPAFRTLFLQEMARNRVLINYLAPSIAHDQTAFEATCEALDKTLDIYTKALEASPESFLEGPVIKPVFRAVN